MRKLVHKLLIIIAFSISLLACTPGESLSGAAGADATEAPVVEAPPAEEPPAEAPPVEAPPAEAPPMESQPVEAPDITFYIVPTKDGSFKTISEITTPSMGIGAFEITLPEKMTIGESKSIRLIIVPNSEKVNKSQTMPYSQGNQDPLQIIQGNIEIWSPLRAELKSSDSIDIVSDEFLEKNILSTSPAIWNWLVTANKGGKQTFILSIVLPLPNNSPPLLLAQMDLEIFVEELPTPTQTPVPTPTSAPSVGQQFVGSAVEVLGIFIPATVTIIVTTIGIVLNNKFKEKKEKKEQAEREQKRKKAKQDFMGALKAKPDESKRKNKITRK